MLFKSIIGLLVGNLISLVSFAQGPGRFSLDMRAGIPSILTEAKPEAAPFGGFGARFAFNNKLSVGLTANGGALVGRSNVGYFRNNFVSYGAQVYINPLGFTKRNENSGWKKFNISVGFGASQMHYFLTLKNVSFDNKLNRVHFLYETSITMKYYINEMIDFTAGTNFFFSQTEKLDNVIGNGKHDAFMLSSIGLAIKFLPTERKQHVEWSHLPLAFTSGPITEAKNMVNMLDKNLRESEQRGHDSITKVLRGEIKIVDDKVANVNTKVDSVDHKLNQVLDILNRMSTQGVNLAKDTTKKVVPVKTKKGTKPTKGKGKTTGKDKKVVSTKDTLTIAEKDTAKIVTEVKNLEKTLTYTAPDGSRVKAAVLDPAKVKENYAIVVGAFLVDENAIKARDTYITKGWDAHILGTPKSQLKRIVIFSNNYFEASKIVTELRQTGKPDAWMLDISTGKGVYIK